MDLPIRPGTRGFHEGRAVPDFDNFANICRVFSASVAGNADNDRRPSLDLTKINPLEIPVDDLGVGTIWKGSKNLGHTSKRAAERPPIPVTDNRLIVQHEVRPAVPVDILARYEAFFDRDRLAATLVF